MDKSLSSSWMGRPIPIDTKVRCEFESEVFGGFVSIVDTMIAQNVEEVLIFAVSELYGVLETNKFEKILTLAKLRNFRIKSCDGDLLYLGSTPSRGIKTIIITDTLEPLK